VSPLPIFCLPDSGLFSPVPLAPYLLLRAPFGSGMSISPSRPFSILFATSVCVEASVTDETLVAQLRTRQRRPYLVSRPLVTILSSWPRCTLSRPGPDRTPTRQLNLYMPSHHRPRQHPPQLAQPWGGRETAKVAGTSSKVPLRARAMIQRRTAARWARTGQPSRRLLM